MNTQTANRHIGLLGATSVGVGAIVGGGILVLAGTAFVVAGPSAILAFALNGLVALLTALSYAEVSSKFPESGGAYTFAKKVLSIEAAFTVGWVAWFASIVAAVLYAIGFGWLAADFLDGVWRETSGPPPAWLTNRVAVVGLAVLATVAYTLSLIRKPAGGGKLVNAGKLAVFAILIACGLWALRDRPGEDLVTRLRPFFMGGAGGLFQAMGFTFTVVQGFELIAAVGGEIREPERTIPRSMLLSLAISLAIYLPLVSVVMLAGTRPGESIAALSQAHPEAAVAVAVQNYLGRFGYWLVIVAGLLAMLSALQANLFAASRLALAMARDRTLPRVLASVSEQTQNPVASVLATAAIVVVILVLVPDVAAAGAASSLIFLVTFAIAHWIAILVRQRSGTRPPPFRIPLFPAVPVLGGLACLALAVYQGISVPSAGRITLFWLCIGGLLFLGLFARRARVADASGAALDPELRRLRGHTPLVLVPIANPENARALVEVAGILAPPEVGRVLMLSVAVAPHGWRPAQDPRPLQNVQQVLGEAIAATVEAGTVPEALATVAEQPWPEIARVARAHRCESLLLGLSQISAESTATPLERLMGEVNCDMVVLRAPKDWQLSQVRRILVPTGGRGGHDRLLARLLGSLSRSEHKEITYLKVLHEQATSRERDLARQEITALAAVQCAGAFEVQIVCSDHPVRTVAEYAAKSDLAILGVQHVSRRQKLFGQFALQVALRTPQPLLLISARG